MPIPSLATFGQRSKAILREAEQLAADSHLCRIYAGDTVRGPAQGDYDLLGAAHCLELAARDLRQLHARIETLRQDAEGERA